MKSIINHLLIIMMIMAVSSVAYAAGNHESDDSTRSEMLQNVKTLLRENDSYMAIAFINGQGEPTAVADVYTNLVNDFYWKEHSLPDVITIARAGIQYCLTKADELQKTDIEEAERLKGTAKTISYNLASYTWLGWDEKGIVITHSDILIGLDAAHLNLRLARELSKGNLRTAMAYWILGAQLIAVQKYDEAIEAFKSSKEYAHSANDRLNELLADGYIGVTKIIAGEEDGKELLGEAISNLNEIGSEDAKFFIEQFNTALNQFIK